MGEGVKAILTHTTNTQFISPASYSFGPVGYKVGTLAADTYSARCAKENALVTSEKLRYGVAVEAAAKVLAEQS